MTTVLSDLRTTRERFFVNESSSYVLELSWDDGNAAPTQLVTIATLALTLYVVHTREIVNSREAQDVLNANNCTFHATSGLMSWNVQPADTAIVTDAVFYEPHRAVFELVLTNGVTSYKEVDFVVKNLHHVPFP